MNTLLIVLLILILIGLIGWLCYLQYKKSKDPLNVIKKEIKRLEHELERNDLSEEDRRQLLKELMDAAIKYRLAINKRDTIVIDEFKRKVEDLTENLQKKNLELLRGLQDDQRKMDEEQRKKDQEIIEEIRRLFRDI